MRGKDLFHGGRVSGVSYERDRRERDHDPGGFRSRLCGDTSMAQSQSGYGKSRTGAFQRSGNTGDRLQKVAAIGFGNIFVNLQGRETGGIVPPEEYEDTVSRIITALQDNMRSPDGMPYLAFAVRKEEAGFVGQGGERAGDVIYGATGSYASITVHAEQIPTARNKKYGSMNCLGILSGPGVRGGATFSGPVGLPDLAPTLSFLLDYPIPRESNGRIITQILNRDFPSGKK